MPFARPTLAQIAERIASDLESRLPGADARLRRSVLSVIGRTEAGAVHGLYGYGDFIARQVFPDTAESEFLDRWAAVWGITRKPAWPASGTVTATGTDGAVIPAGSALQRGDGRRYLTSADATIVAGTADLTVTAEEAGADGNAAVGTKLTFVSPIADIEGTATVAGDGLIQGSDQEGDATVLARTLGRIQEPPHGGAAHDYVAWALDRDAHGIDVTRAWERAGEYGPGSVTVRLVMDDTYPDGIPAQADLDAVAAYIATVKPKTAKVYVVAPVSTPIAFTIAGLDPATQAVRDAIEAELRDLIDREAAPGQTLLVSHVREAISVAAGEADHRLVLPAADVVLAPGAIAAFGSLSWS